MKGDSQRKRSKEEVAAFKEEEKRLKVDKRGFLEEFKNLKEENKINALNLEAGMQAMEIVHNLQ